MTKAKTRHQRHLEAVYDIRTDRCETCGELTRQSCPSGHGLCAACADDMGCVRCLEVAADKVRYP